MSLQVKQLVKHFEGVKAVNGVSFELRAGECVALIGPNGAGKSTLFACIAGQHALTAGEVLWAGMRLNGLSPALRLARGVARTFQVAQTFEALTVLQNVQLLLQAPYGLAPYSVLDDAFTAEALALLARVGLQHLAHTDALGLPYGAKKRLELAMALANLAGASGPRLLLLDEPAAGLAGAERSDLMALIQSLAHDDSNIAVLYTEHNMDAVFGVADRVLVLIDGLVAAQGLPHEIAQNELVRTRYLGQVAESAAFAKPVAASKPALVSASSTPVLKVQDLNVWYGAAQALFGVSLQVGRGELVVLQGLNGAGKTTLLQAIMGLSPRVVGLTSYENNNISNWPAHQRARAGLGYVAEDRRLFAGLTVAENLSVVARGNAHALQEKVLDMFPALKPLLQRQARQMSGGEQQMLAIARTLMTEPRCLLLDEPCEGISPVLIEGIVHALLQLRAQGMPMLVAEQNKLLADRADRVITLVAGQLSL